jgi:hypothetical protein
MGEEAEGSREERPTAPNDRGLARRGGSGYVPPWLSAWWTASSSSRRRTVNGSERLRSTAAWRQRRKAPSAAFVLILETPKLLVLGFLFQKLGLYVQILKC